MDQNTFNALIVLFVFIPVIIGYTTYSNKMDGLIYGAIATIISLLLPYLFIIKSSTEEEQKGDDIGAMYSLSFVMTLIIITTVIIFVIRH